MIGRGKNNKFILVDGTSSSGKSTICKYFSKKEFLCFQIDNYWNDKRINDDVKKIKNDYGEIDKIYEYKTVKYMIDDAINPLPGDGDVFLFNNILNNKYFNVINTLKYLVVKL